MYRKGKNTAEEYYEPMSNEEYELYRYNIPPRYDGSRFRRRRDGERASGSVGQEAGVLRVEGAEDCTFEERQEEPAAPVCNDEPSASLGGSHTEERGILSRLTEKLGSEELLMIAVALAISGGDGSGDALLLLLLLLCQDS